MVGCRVAVLTPDAEKSLICLTFFYKTQKVYRTRAGKVCLPFQLCQGPSMKQERSAQVQGST